MLRIAAAAVLLGWSAGADAAAPERFTIPVGNATATLEIDDGGHTFAFSVIPPTAVVDLATEAAAFGTLLDQRLAADRPQRFYLSLNGNAAVAAALGRALAVDPQWDAQRARPAGKVAVRVFLLRKLTAAGPMSPLYRSFGARGFRLVPVTAAKIFVSGRGEETNVSIGELGFDATAGNP